MKRETKREEMIQSINSYVVGLASYIVDGVDNFKYEYTTKKRNHGDNDEHNTYSIEVKNRNGDFNVIIEKNPSKGYYVSVIWIDNNKNELGYKSSKVMHSTCIPFTEDWSPVLLVKRAVEKIKEKHKDTEREEILIKHYREYFEDANFIRKMFV